VVKTKAIKVISDTRAKNNSRENKSIILFSEMIGRAKVIKEVIKKTAALRRTSFTPVPVHTSTVSQV
jgi:hypothetical protein